MSDAVHALDPKPTPYRSPTEAAIEAARAAWDEVRGGRHRDVTSGLAPAIVQANLAILPEKYANDFLRYCQLNPKPCPLIGMTEPGDPALPMLGEDIDLRTDLPAITHIDYSARIQSVHKETNPQFHALLSAFDQLTGCGVVVNTSFNVRGEPIVCTPLDAYRCFMRTEMDSLVIGNMVFAKMDQPVWNEEGDWRETFELD